MRCEFPVVESSLEPAVRKRVLSDTTAPSDEGTTTRRWTSNRNGDSDCSRATRPPTRSTPATWNWASSEGPSESMSSARVSGAASVSWQPTSKRAAESRRTSVESSPNSSAANRARRQSETTSCSTRRTIVASVKPPPSERVFVPFTMKTASLVLSRAKPPGPARFTPENLEDARQRPKCGATAGGIP